MSFASLVSNRIFHITFLAYTALMVFLGRHGSMGISNYDEAFYAQKAKEMLVTGSLWTVNYHGQATFENPPLPMWTMALAFKFFGVSEYAVALPSALLGAASVILTYRFAETLFNDRWTAFLSGIILVLPGFFVDYARRGMVDTHLVFFVTSALYCFACAGRNPRWYLLFGLFTAFSVLTKSILGFFPLVIGFAYLMFARPGSSGRESLGLSARFNCLYLWFGVAIALCLGSSWYIVSALRFGESFIQTHFGWLILHRGMTGHDAVGIATRSDPFFFFGYVRALWKNYWPWIPIATVGMVLFARRTFRENDNRCLFILLWIAVFLGVMSAGRLQVLRYILALFPALAILTAKTIADGVSESHKETLTPVMIGMALATMFFVNATTIELKQSISLSQQSQAVRHLAPAIYFNSRDAVENYRLTPWNPRNAVMFYTDRFLSEPVKDEDGFIQRIEEQPESTWLSTVEEFRKLQKTYPGKLYLIAAYEKFAYFTTEQNRENIRYDFSAWRGIR